MASGPVYLKIGAETTDLTAKLAVAKADFSAFSAELRASANQMRDAGAGASEEMKAGLAKAAQAAAQARAEMTQLNVQLKESVGASGGAAAGINEFKASMEASLAPLTAAREAMGAMSEVFLVGFGVERIGAAIEHTEELGASLLKLSEQTGVAVEALSGLHYAADQVDVSSDSMDAALKRIGRSVQEALKNPASDAAKAFNALGLSQNFLRDNSNNVLGVILKMADGFHSHADGAAADAAAMATMGRGGVELIPVMRQGSAALEENFQKNKALGGQMTGPMAVAMDQHKKAVKDLGTAFGGLGNAMTAELAGPFGAVTRFFTGQLTLLTNIKERIGQMVGVLPNAPTAGPLAGKGEWKEKEDKPAIDFGNDNASKEYFAQVREQLQQQLLDLQLFGQKAETYELGFWKDKLAVATAGGASYANARREITSQIYEIESRENAQELSATEKADRDFQVQQQKRVDWVAQSQAEITSIQASYDSVVRQIRDQDFANFKEHLEEMRDAAKGSFAEILQLDQELVERAKGVYGEDTAAFREALKQKSADQKAEIDKQLQPYKTLVDGIGNSFKTMFDGILQGTQTFQQMMGRMASNLIGTFAQTAIRVADDWAVQQIRQVLETQQGEMQKTAAATLGAADRQAVEDAAYGVSSAAQAAAGSVSVLGDANKAAAGAYAAVAGIPYVGPFLAPEAAAVAFAAVSAFDIFSAAGGFDVPGGVNPITQLHENEMVLPANIAEGIRNMTAGQAAGGGGQKRGDVHFHISAVDSRSFEQRFNDPRFMHHLRKKLQMHGIIESYSE